MSLGFRCGLEDLVQLLGAESDDPALSAKLFEGRLAPFEKAGPDELAILPSQASSLRVKACRAGFLVGTGEQKASWLEGGGTGTFLVVPDPSESLMRLLQGPCRPPDDPDDWLAESEVVRRHGREARTASIHRAARIAPGVRIGPGAVLHPRVEVGEGCWIGDGASVGSPGFGLQPSEGRWRRYPHWAGVVLGNGVEIGPGCQISAGLLDPTWIGDGVHLDSMVQVGHNCRLGRGCAIAAQSGLSGSVELGDRCRVGGQAGFADHVHLGDDCWVAARAGVTKSWPAGSRLAGFPAEPIGKWRRSAGSRGRSFAS